MTGKCSSAATASWWPRSSFAVFKKIAASPTSFRAGNWATSSKGMRLPRRIPPLEKGGPAMKWLLLLLLGVLLLGVAGCETNEPDNASVRPWNSPQGWEGNSPLLNQQHQ